MPLISGGSGGGGLQGTEIGYDPISVTVSIASTSEAAPTTVITCASHTFDGAAVMLQVFTPRIAHDTAAIGNIVGVALWEGASELGVLGLLRTEEITTQDFHPFSGFLRFAPTAGSHTYLIRCWASSTTGNPAFVAGAGGVGTDFPAFARFTKV